MKLILHVRHEPDAPKQFISNEALDQVLAAKAAFPALKKVGNMVGLRLGGHYYSIRRNKNSISVWNSN